MVEYVPEGGYSEGPGYWSYATTYSAIAIAEMEGVLGNGLRTVGAARVRSHDPLLRSCGGPVRTGVQLLGCNGRFADFSGADVAGEALRRAVCSGAYTGTALADYLEHHPVTPFDRGIWQGTVINRFFALHEVWFPEKRSESVANPLKDFHFTGVADIATFRSAWNDPNAIFVGVKAGETDEHHKHLDLGSFVMDADGQRWAMDLGGDSDGGSYTLPSYGDVKGTRWTYFRTNNHGHNTVTPGDGLQSIHIAAPITKYGSTPGRAFAVVDLTPVYPNAAASLHRGVALLDRARVLVQDEYEPAQSGLPLHWVMITKAKHRCSRRWPLSDADQRRPHPARGPAGTRRRKAEYRLNQTAVTHRESKRRHEHVEGRSESRHGCQVCAPGGVADSGGRQVAKADADGEAAGGG